MAELNKTNEDWSITTKVRIALKVHQETEPYAKGIKVGTSRGVVYLAGEVPSEEVRKAVTRVAMAVAEVLSIVDELKIA